MERRTDTRAGSTSPLVSVVLPAFNGSRTILKTLESLRKQDYPRTEWIVVDDGSQDTTAEMVKDYLGTRSQEARLIRHETNVGLSRSLNDGVQATSGEFILIIHQDIELVGDDWISRAVRRLMTYEDVAVMTCHYGIPAADDLNFVKRAFGFLRRQFYQRAATELEFVTFSEFKCDLVRKTDVLRIGGFSTKFRKHGEDLVLSYQFRRDGRRILKDYTLESVQRFTGQAETVLGNLNKEFRFGEAVAGLLLGFRFFTFRHLTGSPYARARSLHRASQPVIAFAALVLLALSAFSSWPLAPWLFVSLVIGRFGYYILRLWPEFSHFVSNRSRAVLETLGASVLGLVSDVVYPLGVATGIVRSAYGAPL